MKKIKDYGWLIVLIFLIGVFIIKPAYLTFGQPEETKPRKVTLVNMRIVDIERIINEYTGAKVVAKELQDYMAREDARCDQYKQEVLKYQRHIKQHEDELTQEELNKYLKAIEIRNAQYEECLKEKDVNSLKKEAELKAPVLTRIYQAIESVALKNGYNMVVDSKTAIFYTKDLDITNEILEELQ